MLVVTNYVLFASTAKDHILFAVVSDNGFVAIATTTNFRRVNGDRGISRFIYC